MHLKNNTRTEPIKANFLKCFFLTLKKKVYSTLLVKKELFDKKKQVL